MMRSFSATFCCWLALATTGLPAHAAAAPTPETAPETTPETAPGTAPGTAMLEPARPGRGELNAALADFDEVYRRGLAEAGIVGSAFVLMQDGNVLHRQSHGVADLATGRRVDGDTIFHWASITKTMTAVAILQLRDRGRLTLDDRIVHFLPELRQVRNDHGDMDEITIRHLLTHTSGFRGPTWPWKSEEWQPHEPREWRQLVAMFPYTRLHFKPGTKWSYSNPAFIFLGRVIEILSGDDYETYIDKNIFKPLGMSRSYFDSTPYHLLAHRSHSYWIADGALRPARFDVDTGITVSNGGLNAPLSDMKRYVDFLTGVDRAGANEAGANVSGVGRAGGNEAIEKSGVEEPVDAVVLRRSSLEEMWQPAIEIGGLDEDGARHHMGLSFFLETRGDVRYVGHSGGQNAFVTHIFLQPETRAAYLIAFNTRTDSSIQERDHVKDQTSELDTRLKRHLFANVFPLLAAD